MYGCTYRLYTYIYTSLVTSPICLRQYTLQPTGWPLICHPNDEQKSFLSKGEIFIQIYRLANCVSSSSGRLFGFSSIRTPSRQGKKKDLLSRNTPPPPPPFFFFFLRPLVSDRKKNSFFYFLYWMQFLSLVRDLFSFIEKLLHLRVRYFFFLFQLITHRNWRASWRLQVEIRKKKKKTKAPHLYIASQGYNEFISPLFSNNIYFGRVGIVHGSSLSESSLFNSSLLVRAVRFSRFFRHDDFVRLGVISPYTSFKQNKKMRERKVTEMSAKYLLLYEEGSLSLNSAIADEVGRFNEHALFRPSAIQLWRLPELVRTSFLHTAAVNSFICRPWRQQKTGARIKQRSSLLILQPKVLSLSLECFISPASSPFTAMSWPPRVIETDGPYYIGRNQPGSSIWRMQSITSCTNFDGN